VDEKTQSSWRGEHDCTVTLLRLSNMGVVHGATNGIQTGCKLRCPDIKQLDNYVNLALKQIGIRSMLACTHG